MCNAANEDTRPFTTVHNNSAQKSQRHIFKCINDSMLNELLWRIEYNIFDNDIKHDISSNNIIVKTKIYSNPQEINLYTKFYKTDHDMNIENDYAHFSFHITGDCFGNSQSGILHYKNNRHNCYFVIRLVKSDTIRFEINHARNASFKNKMNIPMSHTEYNAIKKVLEGYVNNKSPHYLGFKLSGVVNVDHYALHDILKIRSTTSYKFTVSNTRKRRIEKGIQRIAQRRKTHKRMPKK
jgi:hypothetical protein